MDIENDLKKMTVEEKIRAMESIWDDLIRHAPDKISPSWHEGVLQQRAQAEEVGEAQFMDWEAAKKKLRESL